MAQAIVRPHALAAPRAAKSHRDSGFAKQRKLIVVAPAWYPAPYTLACQQKKRFRVASPEAEVSKLNLDGGG